jgi:hypothetical protein
VVPSIQDRDVDWRAAQTPGGAEAAEPSSDDHDAGHGLNSTARERQLQSW